MEAEDSKKREQNNSKQQSEEQEQIIYSTASICPRCALIDQKGLNLLPAKVYQHKDKVWLSLECETHGLHRTLYCSNVEFFKSTLSFNFNENDPFKNKDPPDIEDMKKKMNFSSQNQNLPLMMEIPLWENGNYVENDQLQKRIENIKSLYPPNRNFVLKILGKLAPEVNELNEKAKFVENLVRGGTLILEASYERLCLLCELEDSIFLRPSVFPALKYFLREGDEEQCESELTNLFQYLKSFTGIQLMVTFCVCKPYPNLKRIISFVRQEIGFIRLVVLSMERSPKYLIDSLKQRQGFSKEVPTPQDVSNIEPIDTVDIYELLETIGKSTGFSISPDDFFPLSMASAMEPFLNLMGYGFFYIRPSPFCGYATCLVNTDKSFYSYPVTRLFDFKKLFADLKPILPRLQDGKIGLLNAKKLHKIFLNSQYPNKGPLPDLYSYLTEKSKAEETRSFIQNLQFFVVHNNMDLASFDSIRRCNCMMGSSSTSTKSGVASYCCSGCI